MFMKIARRFGVVAAVFILMVAVAAAGANLTVGDFVVKIAKAKQLDAPNAGAAVSSLRAAGFNMPALDLNKPLTEGTVVQISKSFGISVSTTRPDAQFDTAQVDSYFAAFGTQLNTTPGGGTDTTAGGNGADPLTKGKGKKKGLRTPSDPV
jgi:hypothetical protein